MSPQEGTPDLTPTGKKQEAFGQEGLEAAARDRELGRDAIRQAAELAEAAARADWPQDRLDRVENELAKRR